LLCDTTGSQPCGICHSEAKWEAETAGGAYLIMQFGVRGAIAALFSIIPTVFLTGCETTGSSPAAAAGSSSAIANNPHPDLPRKQIAEFMKTQKGDFLGISPHPVRPGQNVEIAEPKPKPIGGGTWVCVRIGHTDALFGGQGYIRTYGFDNGGKLEAWRSGNVSEGAFYLLLMCGDNPAWKPFPEAQVKDGKSS
jgi:hypothetical protein